MGGIILFTTHLFDDTGSTDKVPAKPGHFSTYARHGQNYSNRLIRLNVRVGPGRGNRAHPAPSPQIIQINRSSASTLSGSMKTFIFFDWLGYTHRYSVSVPQPFKKHGCFCGSRKP
jgi:hypothetical protein